MWFSHEMKQIKNIILSIGHSYCIDDLLFNEKLSVIRVECVLDKYNLLLIPYNVYSVCFIMNFT